MRVKGSRACIYCRISEDREGLENGVGTQESDCLELAKQLDVEVKHTFVDNDISASTLSNKPRPEFDAMLAAVRDGQYDVIISLTNGRLTRRPRELETLIELHNQTGVTITTVKSGTDDLSTADGRMVARIKASVDAAEAERTSERVARDAARRREAGEIHGGPPIFGYVHPTPENGLRYLQKKDERAADAIVQAAALLLNGGKQSQVMDLWNSLGLTRPNGTPWRAYDSVQKILKSPRIAGYTSKDGVAVRQGNWPAIIDFATHQALVEILKPKRGGGSRARKRLLPGFIWCECGTGMIANVSEEYGLNRYLCAKQRGGCGKVSRSRPWVEDAVREYVRARIESSFVAQEDGELPELAELERKVAEREAEIARLRESVKLGVFTASEIAADVIAAREAITALRKEEGSVKKREAKPTLSQDETLKVWLSDDLELLGERREILARYVERIDVHPLGKGGWGVNRPIPPTSITIVPVKRSSQPTSPGPA